MKKRTFLTCVIIGMVAGWLFAVGEKKIEKLDRLSQLHGGSVEVENVWARVEVKAYEHQLDDNTKIQINGEGLSLFEDWVVDSDSIHLSAEETRKLYDILKTYYGEDNEE